MKQHYLKLILIFTFTFSLLSVSVGCSKEPAAKPADDIALSVKLPSVYTLPPGGTLVFLGDGFLKGDKIQLVGSDATLTVNISIMENGAVSFVLPENFEWGYYKFVLIRGDAKKTLGYSHISFGIKLDVPEVEGMNLRGAVTTADGAGVPGVSVSDGVEVVQTDANGLYYIASKKESGFVFISVPGDYTVEMDASTPVMYKRTASYSKDVSERFDFYLAPADNTKYTLIAATDFHLADRNNDLGQFRQGFASEITALGRTKNVHCVTMGDLTWDLYWYSLSFTLSKFRTELSSINVPMYHTMGNHDYDMKGRKLTSSDITPPYVYNSTYAYMNTSDWVSAGTWRTDMGPTYYSFNIGEVHYIVVDNMNCTNGGTSDTRTYTGMIDANQMAWVANDLKFVDPSTPIFVTMHIPHKGQPSTANVASNNLTNSAAFKTLFNGYKEVHILTGHTHVGYNVVEESGGDLWYEHNTPAVCGTWWWTGRPGYTDNNVAPDGAPGGYCVYEIDGKNITWKQKGAGKSIDYQFRSYDLNKTVLLASEWVPNATAALKSSWASSSYAGSYQTAKTNAILLNIWNWDPAWKIKLTEGDGASAKTLTATRVQRRDPLQMISYTAFSMDGGSSPTFGSNNSTHFFEAQATTATETIYIEVTDRFGNVYKETMARPKAVSRTMQ